MQRIHLMPFGPVILPAGQILFQIWAPSAKSVDLCLYGNKDKTLINMDGDREGWFRVLSDQARVGMSYHFLINRNLYVPDPASRFQPQDVHGPSQIIDPAAFDWQDEDWCGRPWESAVIYELHVGAFSPAGTFAEARERLDHLVSLNVTALELMPVADFPGNWNWGYDGVLPFAADSRYGRPEELKELIQAAHQRGIMVFLDVVYNHFGPEGNYLHVYAKPFFTDNYKTPWGSAINFDGPESSVVRQFFINNALFWLKEYHFDGLRLDAVHAIFDHSPKHILTELAETLSKELDAERQVHLILENDGNEAHLLRGHDDGRRYWYTAQWNDDFHHSLHVLATGETSGYYCDYLEESSQRSPLEHLGRALSEGFAYQGERSSYRGGKRRGEPSQHLPATAFVCFLQNHDQIGNRALGERIQALATDEAIEALVAILLLAPSPPLLFMGQEWGTKRPFFYFCNLGPELAPLVTAGRREEFGRCPELCDPARREILPDPSDEQTFFNSVLDWNERLSAKHRMWFDYYRKLLALRHQEVIPRITGLIQFGAQYRLIAPAALEVGWSLAGGSRLILVANLSDAPCEKAQTRAIAPEAHRRATDRLLFANRPQVAHALERGSLLPWSVVWLLDNEHDQ